MNQVVPKKTIVHSAMEAGAFMGGFFVIKFILSILSFYSLLAGYLSLFMFLAIPVVLYHFMRRYYRERENEIVFLPLCSLGILIFFFASLISGLVQFIYYAYINPDYIRVQVELASVAMQALGSAEVISSSTVESVNEVIAEGNIPTPGNFVMAQIWVNVIFGTLLSLVMAGVLWFYFKKIKRDK